MTDRETPTQECNVDASGSSIHLCPICNRDFYGDLPAFEKHINNHLDGVEEEDQEGPHLVANDNHRQPHHPSTSRDVISSGDIDGTEDGKIARVRPESEETDILALAHAIGVAQQADQIAMDHELAFQLQSAEQRGGDGDDYPYHLQHMSNSDSYEKSIAEVADVELECEVSGCGAVVKVADMQTHMDHHLAQQLAQDGFAPSVDSKESARVDDTLTLRILQDDGTLKNLSVKHELDSPEETGRNENKRMRFLKGDQPSSSPEPPATSQSSLSTSGQTTMDGFLRQRPSSSSSGSSAASASSLVSEPVSQRLTFLKKPETSVACSGMIADVIPRLATLLQASVDAKATQAAYLADPSVVFCPSDQTDQGWGCGYRNLQMMLSYVVQQPRMNPTFTENQPRIEIENNSNIDHHCDDIPTILQLQQQLEYAWRTESIDPEGAAQLQWKVVGTRKWIGTTEAWTVLTSLGIRSQILDFHKPTGPNNTHPALFQAVLKYFSSPPFVELQSPLSSSGATSAFTNGFMETVPSGGDSSCHSDSIRRGVIQTRKPPLYMQHQGHSRTIVGIEIVKPGVYRLLIFDPMRKIPQQFMQIPPAPTAATTTTVKLDLSLLRMFRLWLAAGYTKNQYQLLGISGLYSDKIEGPYNQVQQRNKLAFFTLRTALSIGWDADEQQRTKHPTSERIP
ncbi:hypothetical protein BGW41_004174 [Actinomortierella wolfii]|nr:hypothetical protein BGW41_004174 [Actinomortierella wolfii]